MKISKYSEVMPKINVCSVISPIYGNIYNHYSDKYFNSEDMKVVLQSVRKKLGPKAKILMFWDGAKIHGSKTTRDYAQTQEIDI